MKYLGSKNRIAGEILDIMLKGRRQNQYFVEPFCGGCNITDKVQGLRIAADNNRFLIQMWKLLMLEQSNIFPFPMNITKDLYSHVREIYYTSKNKEPQIFDGVVGWVGFMASYNGRFFDGGYSGHDVGGRDYIAENIVNITKQLPKLEGVKFVHSDFEFLEIPPNSIIYCDIPYPDTKGYTTSKNFPYATFWRWCKDRHAEGHKVYISAYDAPDDFFPIWEKQILNTMRPKVTTYPVERLFTLL